MANFDVEPNMGFVDKRKVGRHTAASVATNLAQAASLIDINAKRARLQVINAGYYTTTRLDQMSDNDMDYALRLNDNAAGI